MTLGGEIEGSSQWRAPETTCGATPASFIMQGPEGTFTVVLNGLLSNGSFPQASVSYVTKDSTIWTGFCAVDISDYEYEKWTRGEDHHSFGADIDCDSGLISGGQLGDELFLSASALIYADAGSEITGF